MIRLRTLGTLDLETGGQRSGAILGQPKRVALLTYLALATPRGFHQRETLLALFWPEHDEEHARNSLSQSVHVLRRALGAAVVQGRSDDALGLDRSQFWCDAVAFEESLDAGHVDAAVALYGGDLLDGFHVANAPEFEHWLEAERVRLRGRYCRAVETLAEAREGAGDFVGAVTHWQQVAAHDPYSSRVALRVMRALARAGDESGALHHAREYERLLRQELNVGLDPAIAVYVAELKARAATRSLLASGEAPSRPVLHDAPAIRTDSSPESLPGEGPAAAAERRPRAMRRAVLAAAMVSVVAVVGVSVTPLMRTGASSARGPEREQYLRELFLRGRHAELSRSLAGLETAREAYRRAIAHDSTFALGYAGLAAVYSFLADYRYAPVRPALDSARLMARRAFALDSMSPDVRTALAVTLGDAGQFDAAEQQFVQAIRLGPTNARAHYWYSVLLVGLGRGEEALREARRAAALDSFPPRGVTAMQRYAQWLLTGQRPHLRLPVTQRRPVLKLEPGEPWAHAREAEELAQEGRCDEARAELARAQNLAPNQNFRMLHPVGLVYWRCGEPESARALLREMKARPDAYENGFRIAILHTEFGDRDSALVWLDRQKWSMAELSALSADIYLDPLRDDPRFMAIMQRVGIRGRWAHGAPGHTP